MFLNAYGGNNDNNSNDNDNNINNNNDNKSNDSNVTFDVRPVMWSSPLMITGQTNPKERDRERKYARVYASVCSEIKHSSVIKLKS